MTTELLEFDEFIDDVASVLKAEEGEIKRNGRHVLYKDHLGLHTIGYGRLLDITKPGAGLTDEEAEYLLDTDILNMVDELDSKLPWWRELPYNPRKALLLMSFQLGMPTLLKFKNMLKELEQKNYASAASNALDSRWARQTPARAKRVAKLISG